jgi:hypothetical protein
MESKGRKIAMWWTVEEWAQGGSGDEWMDTAAELRLHCDAAVAQKRAEQCSQDVTPIFRIEDIISSTQASWTVNRSQ